MELKIRMERVIDRDTGVRSVDRNDPDKGVDNFFRQLDLLGIRRRMENFQLKLTTLCVMFVISLFISY